MYEKHKINPNNQLAISIGSNVGYREKNINNAINMLTNNCPIDIKSISPIYETEPFETNTQNWFLNIAITASTQITPNNLFLLCKTIEFYLGRKTAPIWSDRTIDIDILIYNNLILNVAKLTIPHKYLHLRKFVLVPLNDIAPNIIHPVLNKNITQLLNECPDNSIVRKYI